MSKLATDLAAQIAAAKAYTAAGIDGPEPVWCENPEHGEHAHAETAACQYPHYVGPCGHVPAVGHPLTIHD